MAQNSVPKWSKPWARATHIPRHLGSTRGSLRKSLSSVSRPLIQRIEKHPELCEHRDDAGPLDVAPGAKRAWSSPRT